MTHPRGDGWLVESLLIIFFSSVLSDILQLTYLFLQLEKTPQLILLTDRIFRLLPLSAGRSLTLKGLPRPPRLCPNSSFAPLRTNCLVQSDGSQ